jgi:molybdate transport system permease protein
MRGGPGWRAVAGAAAGLTVGFLLLPVVALVLAARPTLLVEKLGDPLVRSALTLSLTTSLLAVLLVALGGVPVAWWLVNSRRRIAQWVEAVLVLPLVLPPTVAGLGLLLAFGRAGLLGRGFSAVGIEIPFTSAAVVVAQVFVGLPFFVLAAAAGFRAIHPQVLEVGATLGSGPFGVFRRIALPLAAPSLLAGAAMAWARGVGEFGATITFAGNLPGRTQTMPVAVYAALQQDLDAALAVAVLLLAISAGVLVAVRAWLPAGRWTSRV